MKLSTTQRLTLMFAVCATVVLSSAGCGGSGNRAAALQAQRRQQHEQQRIRVEHTRESNALKDYNSGS